MKVQQGDRGLYQALLEEYFRSAHGIHILVNPVTLEKIARCLFVLDNKVAVQQISFEESIMVPVPAVAENEVHFNGNRFTGDHVLVLNPDSLVERREMSTSDKHSQDPAG